MHKHPKRGFHFFSCVDQIVLCAIAITGLFTSFIRKQSFICLVSYLMLAVCSKRMSIVSVFIAILPFLILTASICFRKPILVYIYFYIKFFCIGIMLQAIRLAYPAGEWIVF